MEKFIQIHTEGAKMIAAAAERNKGPILDVLKQHLTVVRQPGLVLEVSSGTGQHVAWFAPHFPDLTFQPTEFDRDCLESIKAHIKEGGLTNVRDPHILDASKPSSHWLGGSIQPGSLSAIINVNMIHISSQKAVEGLFAGAGSLLCPGGRLITYGPYAVDGKITPESNVNFDRTLRSRNPEWGLRDIVLDLQPLAAAAGLSLTHTIDMPANNKVLVWQKKQ
ncbi:Methyltransferase-like 26 [Frankliniella fusca]|uniref:Methyltransferase-like 26 n=1 Tax=Frankliniella fusca TaxID=407009 RepID=A0AAE1I0T8_9NEOP|nr:Methyltransferase-like 26 [Frankliniella fusca]